jgi:hypothetical protein
MEYMALGDYQTAVGFLLSAPPERSARYYRDALCTLALAAAAVTGAAAGSGGGADGDPAAAAAETASRTLLVQAAKVVTANAASVGDTLLGVPLLCAAGAQQSQKLQLYGRRHLLTTPCRGRETFVTSLLAACSLAVRLRMHARAGLALVHYAPLPTSLSVSRRPPRTSGRRLAGRRLVAVRRHADGQRTGARARGSRPGALATCRRCVCTCRP